MSKPEQRVVGQLCPDCKVGTIVLSKKNTPYCDQKCWLTGADQDGQTPPASPPPATDEMTKVDWEQKDLRIAKQALAKSFIEKGMTFAQASPDLEKWLTFIKREEPPV